MIAPNKIRILHLAECAGGVDHYLRMLLKYMDRSRFEHVVVASHNYRADDYRGLADRFIHVDMRNALSLGADARAVREVRRLVRELCPDVVYCHSSKAGGVGRLACVGLGVQLIYNPHGWAFCMRGSRLKRCVYLQIERLLSHLTDRFVVISAYEKLMAVKHRVARDERIRVIFNGIDIDEIRGGRTSDANRSSLGIATGAYVVGMVGRLSAQKAPDVFVRMAERVKEVIPEAHFLMVGDGEQRTALEREIAHRGLTDCFTITGWVADAVPYIRLMDQAVLLSRWEGFGLAIVEYMAAGRAVVATEVGGIADLITDYYNGLLLPPDDDRRAAEAVIELYKDIDMKKEFIERSALRTRAFFDVRRTALEHERLIVNICKRGG